MAKFIAVDIGGSKIAAGIVKSSRVIQKINVKTPKTKDALIKVIISSIESLDSREIKGIGIGAAGRIDSKGNWLDSPNIRCVKNIPLRSIIQKRFRKRTAVDNDANCFALGEAISGAGKKSSIVFGIILGTGTGGGIVLDKRIMRGACFLAGEVGHMPYLDSTFEMYCSGRFIIRMAAKKGLKAKHPKAVADLAEKGDKNASAVYSEFGEHIGMLVCSIISVLNPGIIVIGGGLSRSYNLFRRSMIKTIRKKAFFGSAKKTCIKPSENDDSGLIGAALLLHNINTC